MKVYIGTSGWQYLHWKGKFYPEGLKSQDFLKFYSQYFKTVEVNTSFYHFTKRKTLENWRAQVGKNFLFSLKLHRLFTHTRRLRLKKEDKKILKETLESFKVLKNNLGPILIQLPPSLKENLKLLEKFVSLFDKNFKLVIEFRHKSWLNEKVYQFLKKKKIAFVISDSPRWPTEIVKTTDFVYIRFHGKPKIFASKYKKEELKRYAKEIKKLKPKILFAYFNNDAKSYATKNALEFKNLLT